MTVPFQGRETIERLEICGVGDPSGRGLGFSYVRAAPKASMSSAVVKKKSAAGRGGSTVTGTDSDLRRLSMEAAREVNTSALKSYFLSNVLSMLFPFYYNIIFELFILFYFCFICVMA